MLPVSIAAITALTAGVAGVGGVVIGLLAQDYYKSAKEKEKQIAIKADRKRVQKYYVSKGLQNYYEGR